MWQNGRGSEACLRSTLQSGVAVHRHFSQCGKHLYVGSCVILQGNLDSLHNAQETSEKSRVLGTLMRRKTDRKEMLCQACSGNLC